MSYAIINCEDNGCLLLGPFILEDGFFKSNVVVRSDWYEARASFYVSKERLEELLLNLEKISNGSISEAIFINEDGSFEIDFYIDHLGKARIAGVLIESMMDSSALSYELYSDSQSITEFYKQMKTNLSQ